MASFNRVILMGNLTRDPELRYTPKGTAIAKLGLAVNRTWRTETGETKEEVTFVDIDSSIRSGLPFFKYCAIVSACLPKESISTKVTSSFVSPVSVRHVRFTARPSFAIAIPFGV